MIYETDDDRRREQEIIDIVAAKWKCVARKCPKKYSFDYLLLRDGIGKAIAEVRDRPTWTMESFDAAGGYMISGYKVERSLAFAELAQIPFFAVVRCTEEVYAGEVARDLLPGHLGWFDGNNEPRREDDKEPVFYFPASIFRLLKPLSAGAAPAQAS